MSSPRRDENASPEQENRRPAVFSPKPPRSAQSATMSPLSRPAVEASSPLEFNSPLPRPNGRGAMDTSPLNVEFSSPLALPRASNAPDSANYRYRGMVPSTAKSSPMQFSSELLSDLATSRANPGRSRTGLYDNAGAKSLLSSSAHSTARPAYVRLLCDVTNQSAVVTL